MAKILIKFCGLLIFQHQTSTQLGCLKMVHIVPGNYLKCLRWFICFESREYARLMWCWVDIRALFRVCFYNLGLKTSE